MPLYNDLGLLAARVLKPGGVLVVYTGGYDIFEIGDYLIKDAGLKYWFYGYVKHTGSLAKMWGKNA